jgi:hypothetical protein
MSTLKVNKLEKVSGDSKFILQSKRFQAPELQTTVTQFSGDADDLTPSTSNTESKWTAVFTPVSSTSIIIGQYTCQEDAQGTGGWLLHSCFVGSTFLSASIRYARNANMEPFSQVFSFEHDHNSSSAITYDFRYASTANIYLRINRFDQEGGNTYLKNNCGVMLWEVEQ